MKKFGKITRAVCLILSGNFMLIGLIVPAGIFLFIAGISSIFE